MMNQLETFLRDEPLEGRVLITERVVCPTCDGTGTTWLGRPSYDAVSFTESEWGELDYEEQDDFRSGTYDRPCPECRGENVVTIMSPESDPTLIEAWERWLNDYYEHEAVRRMELAAGC